VISAKKALFHDFGNRSVSGSFSDAAGYLFLCRKRRFILIFTRRGIFVFVKRPETPEKTRKMHENVKEL
jgi:hypothetical protein